MDRLLACCLASVVFLCAGISLADTFGSGANAFDIDFVTIGNPENPPDFNPNPAGAVPYEYRIGKYEISEQMIDKANSLGELGITKDTRGPDYPVTSVTWYEAAKFVNWLNTSIGGIPAYKFDGSGNFQLWTPSDLGYDSTNLYRNRLAKYFLPSIHEWHKAAYYNPATGTYFAYTTGSNSAPDGIDFPGDSIFDAVFYDGGDNGAPNVISNVGAMSPFGTVGQGGNVFEWDETAFDRVNTFDSEQRVILGGAWLSSLNALAASMTFGGITPSYENATLGFRVARSVVPEPSTLILFASGLLSLYCIPRRRSHPRKILFRTLIMQVIARSTCLKWYRTPSNRGKTV